MFYLIPWYFHQPKRAIQQILTKRNFLFDVKKYHFLDERTFWLHGSLNRHAWNLNERKYFAWDYWKSIFLKKILNSICTWTFPVWFYRSRCPPNLPTVSGFKKTVPRLGNKGDELCEELSLLRNTTKLFDRYKRDYP